MRVLVATDGSDPAGIGCDLARDVATRFGGPIRFVAVLPSTQELYAGPWPITAALDPAVVERDAVESLECALEREVARTPAELQPTSVLRRGSAPTEIVAAAADWNAELIVVGSRGHNALSTILLGSVAEAVIDHAPVPVLVARLPRLHRLVIGVDGSIASDAAVEFLATHLGATGIEAVVVDVAPSPYPWWLGLGAADAGAYETFVEAAETLRRDEDIAADGAARRLAAAHIVTEREARVGDAADGIVRAADEHGADAIVIGSRGQTGVARMLAGSVAKQVLRHAPVSVLIVHPTVRKAEAPATAHDPGADATPGAPEETTMRILLAYDGSAPAQRALDTAASIARALGSALDVVSVVPFQPGRAPIAPWDDRAVHDEELLDAKRRLEAMGIACRMFEPIGDPAAEIERIAREGRYQMVVVGSRHQGLVGRVLQGSVSEHVATHSDATVVVAR